MSEKARTRWVRTTAKYRRTEHGRAAVAQACWKRRGHVGATWEKFSALVKRQRGCCAICQRKPNGKGRLHWDHDHATGRPRGALCFACNVRVDRFERGVRFTDRKLNARMREYLKRAA